MNLPRSRFLKLLGLGMAGVGARAAEPETLRIGIVTDCQYADIDTPPKSKRQYRLSPKKLQEAVNAFNKMDDLHVALHLGDMIDKDVASYDTVMPIFKKLKAPAHQVIGNHDYSIPDEDKARVPELMGMKSPYYSFIQNGWKFILLDGNEMSLFANGKDAEATKAAKQFQAATKHRKLPEYCGGLGEKQRGWLEAELKTAKAAGQKALIFCHYPLLPIGPHSLWDAEAVLEVIKPYADILPAWFNGHNHDGNYTAAHGIHFLNFRGMVDTEQNTYARMDITPSLIKVTGFGREPSRELVIPAKDAPPETKV